MWGAALPLPSPPLPSTHCWFMVWVQYWIQTEEAKETEVILNFFFYSGIKFFGFCFSLKMRPQCLPACFLSLLLHHARSDGWFHHPSCFFYFLFPESGIIRLWEQQLKVLKYCMFFFTFVYISFNEYSLNWYEYLYSSRERPGPWGRFGIRLAIFFRDRPGWTRYRWVVIKDADWEIWSPHICSEN